MTNSIDDICLWHKSPSITEGNEMYIKCYFECNGYDTKCPYYHDIKYFKDLCQKSYEKWVKNE